jgi:hypothetical protein
MKPTRVPVLLAVALLVAAVVWALGERIYNALPLLPWYAPATVGVLAVAELYAAWAVRSRLYGRLRASRPIEPMVVARAAALAKASSLAGAVVTGGYGGLLAYLRTLVDATRPGHDAYVSGVGLGAGLALTLAALLLERACRVPRDRDDDRPGGGGDPSQPQSAGADDDPDFAPPHLPDQRR